MLADTDGPIAPLMPNHECYFINTSYTLKQLEAKVVKTILEKNLDRQEVQGTWNNVT